MQLLSQKTWPATLDSLYDSMEFVLSCASDQGLEKERIGEIELVMEEVLVNIIKYAYKGKDVGNMEISCSGDDGKFIIEISDAGVPFNILEAADPDVTANVDERAIGGLGIYFVKQLIDEVKYQREKDQNRLTLTVFKKKS